MKAIETPSKPDSAAADTPQKQGGGSYQKVFDKGKRRVRGLWRRNGRFYAQLKVLDAATGLRVPRRARLESAPGVPVTTLPQAIEALNALKVKRKQHDGLKLDPKRSPLLADYSASYLSWLRGTVGVKTPKTIQTEAERLKALNAVLGQLRLSQVTTPVVKNYLSKRTAAGVSPRTINMELIVVRNVMKHAVEAGVIPRVPFEVASLSYQEKKAHLLDDAEVERLCAAALGATENGQQFADLLRLLCHTGGRLREVLELRWPSVSFQRRQLTFEKTKNKRTRTVDFNPKLEAVLLDMWSRRQQDTDWVFPRYARGDRDVHWASPNNTMRKVRQAAGVPHFHFHLTRHYFISKAVMAGIDYLTIAQWVGHRDGGVLIGRIYGHLSDPHRQAQAQRLNF